MPVDRLGWKNPVAMDKHTHTQVNVLCRWQFMSEGSDVGFGIFLKTKMGERQRAGEMTEVLPNQRYNSHMVPEDGTLTCSEPGICKYLGFGDT